MSIKLTSIWKRCGLLHVLFIAASCEGAPGTAPSIEETPSSVYEELPFEADVGDDDFRPRPIDDVISAPVFGMCIAHAQCPSSACHIEGGHCIDPNHVWTIGSDGDFPSLPEALEGTDPDAVAAFIVRSDAVQTADVVNITGRTVAIVAERGVQPTMLLDLELDAASVSVEGLTVRGRVTVAGSTAVFDHVRIEPRAGEYGLVVDASEVVLRDAEVVGGEAAVLVLDGALSADVPQDEGCELPREPGSSLTLADAESPAAAP